MNLFFNKCTGQLICMAGALLIAQTAGAASFDCAKAQTKVEHIICDTPEVSKLDEELNTAYKAAVQDKQQADTIKKAQKQWMKERNNCADAECVKRAYESQLSSLSAKQKSSGDGLTTRSEIIAPVKADELSQAAQSKEENSGSSATTRKYPPYPDVWDMRVQVPAKATRPRVSAVPLDSGDIGIGFFVDRGHKRTIDSIRDRNFTWLTFFDRQTTASPNMANSEIQFSDGSVVRANETMPTRMPGAAELKDGSYIISSQGAFWRGCYQGPAGNTITRYQSRVMRKPLEPSRVAFLLLDDPITIATGSQAGSNRPAACDAAENEITTRVISLGGELLPLGDGGFLLIDENHGWIVRFDNHLNTQSKLLNKKLFVLESRPLDGLFVEKITGKNYLDEHGYIKMQQVNDDLYVYLNKLNKGEK